MKHFALATMMSLAATVAVAQDETGDDDAFVTFRVLKPEVAQEMATAALDFCHDEGFQVGVTVVDRFGLPQVFLRDRFAGPHVYETSRRKAWTAVTFQSDTSELALQTLPGMPSSAIRDLTEALPLGGGVLVLDGEGSIIAGIGVSGAPSPDLDESCAAAGVAAIEDQIAF